MLEQRVRQAVCCRWHRYASTAVLLILAALAATIKRAEAVDSAKLLGWIKGDVLDQRAESGDVALPVYPPPAHYRLLVRPPSLSGIIVGGPTRSVFLVRQREEGRGAVIPVHNDDPRLSVTPDPEALDVQPLKSHVGFSIAALQAGSFSVEFEYDDPHSGLIRASLPVETQINVLKLEAALINITVLVGRSFDLACVPLWATLSDHSEMDVSEEPSVTFVLRNGAGFVQLENSVITGLAETSIGVVQAVYSKKSAFIRVSVSGIP